MYSSLSFSFSNIEFNISLKELISPKTVSELFKLSKTLFKISVLLSSF